MNKNVSKNISKALKDIIQQLENRDIPYYFTGSRCWNTHTPDSDYDICIHFEDYSLVKDIICRHMLNIKNIVPDIQFQGHDKTEIALNSQMNSTCALTDSDFEHSHYGAGVKIDILGDTLNIIRLLPGDFIFWLFATDSMNTISKINPAIIVNKTFRHSMFENLRSIAKATITYEGWNIQGNALLELIKEHCG